MKPNRRRPGRRRSARAAVIACAFLLMASGVALASLAQTSSPSPQPRPVVLSLTPSAHDRPSAFRTATPHVQTAETNRATVYQPSPAIVPPPAVQAAAAQQVSPSVAAVPPPPVLGRRGTTTVIAGTVKIKLKGTTEFVSLSGSAAIPNGSEIDATDGRVLITVATGHAGHTVTAEAYGGVFLFHQARGPHALTRLALSQPLTGCPLRTLPGRAATGSFSAEHSSTGRLSTERTSTQRTSTERTSIERMLAGHVLTEHTPKRSPARGAAHRSGSKSRHLWVSEGGGSWGTSGRYVSTSVEGTRWLTLDYCDRSEVQVTAGRVRVRDLVNNSTKIVRAGQTYTAVRG